jgi:hypothetical protein
VRIPYFWAEEEEMAGPAPFILGTRYCEWTGMKVFNFHPIHIFLNSVDVKNYQDLKNRYKLQTCTERDASTFTNPGVGCRTFFSAIVDRLATEGHGWTISDLTGKFRAETIQESGKNS